MYLDRVTVDVYGDSLLSLGQPLSLGYTWPKNRECLLLVDVIV